MRAATLLTALLLAPCATPVIARAAEPTSAPTATALDTPHQQVLAAERAFARTMAERDHAAFATFLAEETVFFAGEQATRGKAAVAASWAKLYEGARAPFSWEPDQVQVLDSGTLALSTGPVRDPGGRVIARFNSIWRLEAPGTWRVVFDKGAPACDCAKP